MTFVDRLRRWRDLSRLRKRTLSEASPSAYGELAERLIAIGETDEALRAAEDGLRMFPDSERLLQVRVFAKKGKLAGEIRKLREEIVRRPGPAAYSRLAAIYRELGQHDDALQAVQECAERYPRNEAPHLIQGEIRLERFVRDGIARDGILAEESLARVVQMNPRSARAQLLLAELNWLVGRLPACREHLDRVLELQPNSREISAFARRLQAEGASAPPPSDDFGEAATRVEDEGAFAHPADEFPHGRRKGAQTAGREPPDLAKVRARIAEMSGVKGVLGALVLDRDGTVVAEASVVSPLSRLQLTELTTSIARAAGDASRRMDTGALVRAEVESAATGVSVARARNLTVGVLYAEPLRRERVWELLQDVVARHEQPPRRERARA